MQTIILLHGALGVPKDLEALSAALSSKGFRVHTLAFSGHAGTGFRDHFGIPQFSRELEDFMESHEPGGAHVFGYSMGGYVALNLALKPGNRIQKIITLGTKFNWSKETVDKETQGLNPELMQQKIPAFAGAMEEKHGTAWKELVLKTAGLMRELQELQLLNAGSLKTIPHKILVGIGDRDKMVSLEETTEVYKNLPNAAMYMLPATKHPVETADASLLSKLIEDFIAKG
jgi:pimeloyl-ACP methyl ester carboxylesterase